MMRAGDLDHIKAHGVQVHDFKPDEPINVKCITRLGKFPSIKCSRFALFASDDHIFVLIAPFDVTGVSFRMFLL